MTDTDIFLRESAESNPAVCSGAYGLQRAVVAVSKHMHGGAVFVWSTCGVQLTCSESGTDADDELPQHELPSEGIAVWEGHIVYSRASDAPSGFVEPELTFEGEVRDPTEDEWQAIRENRNPWPCPSCDGTGFLDHPSI